MAKSRRPKYRSRAEQLRQQHNAALLPGNTPMVFLETPATPGRGYFAKLERYNPTGSMKDRAALHMVGEAIKRGDLLPGMRIADSTSGSLGLGLVHAGQIYGYPVTLVAPSTPNDQVGAQIIAAGAELVSVSDNRYTSQLARARKLREIELLRDKYWVASQYTNPDNSAGYQALGQEIADELGHVDVLVTSVGTGGHSKGAGRELKRRFPKMKMVGVDFVGSMTFGQPIRHRFATGAGSDVPMVNVDHDLFDEIHWVGDPEMVVKARETARTSLPAMSGWTGTSVHLVAEWFSKVMPEGTNIAAVIPDGPQRYADSLYSDSYVRRNRLLRGPTPTEPYTIDRSDQQVVTTWTRTENLCTATRSKKKGRS